MQLLVIRVGLMLHPPGLMILKLSGQAERLYWPSFINVNSGQQTPGLFDLEGSISANCIKL